MGIFDNTGLDPASTPNTEIWAATQNELHRRGLEVHGSLSKGKVDDGATAIVLKATETGSGRVVAVKIYKNPNQQVRHRNGDSIPMTNFFENERQMLAGLQQCPAVPRYYYSVNTESALIGQAIQPFHVMEFIDGKRVTKFAKESLDGDIRHRSERLTDLFQQVLKAIESIHQFGYLHRDVSDGNVLVDSKGRIRLIDLAEASPLGEEHTRLVTTPGLGTDGVATEAQQKVRAVQADDVNHACTIGYALFTGRWKEKDETIVDWQRKLTSSGAPVQIARILAKGMKPRDTNRKLDTTVWNTAKEVDFAIQSSRDGQRSRRRAARCATLAAVVSVVVLTVAAIGYWQIQKQDYSWNLNRLNKERVVLGDKPKKLDPRVRQRVLKAEQLESESANARAAGHGTEATRLLQHAIAEIQRAGLLADDLEKIAPLQQPLQAMLHYNQQWNTDCQAIRSRLEALQRDYLSISKEVEVGDPHLAWKAMSQLQADLVLLSKDNQASYQTAGLNQNELGNENDKIVVTPVTDRSDRKRGMKRPRGATAQSRAAFADLKPGSKYTNSIGQVFVYLGAGTFQMGSSKTEEGRGGDEGDRGPHTVELTKGFFMAIHETTRGAYQEVTGETPWSDETFIREGEDYPATYVSWDDANDKFINQLNALERSADVLPPGWEYRLPTEAQWEYAARAGTDTRFSFGDQEAPLSQYAWYGGNEDFVGEDYSHRVGLKKSNGWGLYDIMGNVWEWTADYYGNYPAGKATNPQGPSQGSSRVFRGGSWQSNPSYCRVARRNHYLSTYRRDNLGFRLALVQPATQ